MCANVGLCGCEVTGRDVRDEPVIRAGDGRTHDAQLAAALDERGCRLEDTVLLVTDENGVETNAERKTWRAGNKLFLAIGEHCRAHIGKPQHGAGVYDAIRVKNARPYRHFSQDMFRGPVGDGELDFSVEFHGSSPVSS